jgi:hypothetical protein
MTPKKRKSELREQGIKSDLEAYRIAQAQKLLNLFEEANGRLAKTVEELEQWLKSNPGKAATAYDRTPAGKIIPDL